MLLHGIIFAALFYFQQANTEVIDIVRPPAVKALLVAENPQAKNEALQRQQAQRVQDQRREEQRRQEQARADEQRRAEQQRREAEQRAQQQKAELERQEQQQRQAQERRVAEQRQREEQQKREAEQKQQELAQQEAARQEALRQEQAQRDAAAAAAAAEVARTDAELVMAYSAVIHDLVQQNWSRPPSARNGMVAVLRIQMVPTGDILNVEIVQSSGDYAFDRAAESAVLKVRRFTELQGMNPRLFDRNFRSFLLTFRPQDLLN